MDKKEIVKYWIKSSDNDYETMDFLFRGNNYSWSLFVGHIVVEKLLKAYYTKNIDANTPYIHDLLRIADKAKLELSEEQKNFLDTLTSFNIKARYDDYKLKFYKICTEKFTTIYIGKIRKFRIWIKKLL
ncbi:MAG: DNA-binding protein [Omnitrophica WOR_2 bacterium RIFOXYB2_FULL_45_11]|nr:MAG: DNA-binding protein [Omnitrophica WOR_2 bacterium RIFOXYA2_FULL_45_12]OGX51702.1 MAG: DNA-binding protein [Omnitrophica WOR_2 bacterium RIFOXYB2_FULL_45_11]HBU08172.1 DNA-binding protein [Candidatus Omnitrophota bacterium]